MRKYVVTGGACCGKTTLIKELERRGCSVLHEVAREVLEERGGRKVNQKEWELRQGIIFERQLKKELGISKSTFLDRGLVDSLVYSKILLGYVPKKLENFEFRNLYDKVFVLDRLPLIKDGLRIEKDEGMVDNIHNALIKTYRELGYEPVFVPDIGITKRADFILDCAGRVYA